MYMVDPVQMVLLVVILVLTGLLVVLGIQVFYILRELRDTISKTNKVLDHADSISENIDVPLSALSSLVVGAKASSLITIAKLVGSFLGRNKENDRRERD
jgi:predicted PurR-regulated permease PerM